MDSRQAKTSLREFASVIQHEVRRHKLRIRRRPWIDPDDLQAIAQVATLEAVTRFDVNASQTMSLRGFVRRTIRQRLHDSIDSDFDTGDRVRVIEVAQDGTVREYWASWVMIHTVSLDQVTSSGDGRDMLSMVETLVHEDYDPDAVENALSDKLLLQKIIAHARLSSRHVQVLSAILREQSEISLGRELGISKQKINVDKMEMLSILRRYCESQTRKPPAKVLTAPS